MVSHVFGRISQKSAEKVFGLINNLETSENRIGHLNWIQLKLVGIHRTTRFQKKMLLLHN